MTLKRLATIISVAAGTVLVVGGVIFMVFAWRHSDDKPTEDRILNVSLPREPAGSDRTNYLLVEVNENGNFVVDGGILDDNEVLEKLKTLARVQEDVPIRLRGVGETSWQSMIRAVDLIESSGLTNVKFSTPRHEPE